jgi:5-(carboxyamino)imidazole ribonucleotide synthase
MTKTKGPILPGATLGVLGGGQLGRMLAMAARTLGYHISALDPDSSCAARFVVDHCIAAAFNDADAAAELARRSDVVTLEIEKIGLASLDAAARHAPVRPSRAVLAIVQDRAKQKQWLEKNGFPVGPWTLAKSAADVARAAKKLHSACFVKATHGGYDGRGQVQIASPREAASAWKELGAPRAVVEKALAIEAEISILVARRPSGEMAVHPPALNHHVRRILEYSVMPAPIDPKLAARAAEIARGMAKKLDLEGLLVVELFVTQDRELFVNELAPRPHNTFHGTEIGCLTSQFEQAVRAVCDLPLGSTKLIRPVAIHNLLGDLWKKHPPAFERALALPGVRVHLYGKREARPGRKMGHLSATGRTAQEAIALVKRASAVLV